jgi:beta-N-acetylhexosaminidase
MIGAAQTRKLVLDLQKIAKDAGHETPLLIGIDQENGELLPGFSAQCNLAYSRNAGLVSAFSSPTAGAVL